MTVALPRFDALAALLAVRPACAGIDTAAQALGLQRHQLLHAGPPLRDARRPPPVLRSSVVMSCLHEGWAATEDEAEAMLLDGRLDLQPAQPLGCVTPLAAIVTPSTPLFVVHDAAGTSLKTWAPVSTVGGPDTRAGSRDAAVLQRLRHRDLVLAPALARALAGVGGVELLPLAAAGLAEGDDLHSRTAAANATWVARLRSRGLDDAVADGTAGNPLFFLTLWMAACSLLLRAAEGGDRPGLVTRAGGNGESFAIALAGAPDRWTTCSDNRLVGPRFPGRPDTLPLAGAIGDSAVIDLLGLGAQRLALAPEPLAAFGPFLPDDVSGDPEAMSRRLLALPHPGLPGAWPVGVDAQRVVAEGAAPLVVLAMLAADGETGMIGRGLYRPPVSMFTAALAALHGRAGTASTA